MDGTAFGPETQFRSQIVGEGGSYVGECSFSAYFEIGDRINPSELAAALRAVFQAHGLDVPQFSGTVYTPLDWPQQEA